MQKFDGKTNGPAGFTGKLGKALKDCKKLPVNVHFNLIPTELITVDCDDLSTDQKYLLEIHRAASQGRVDDPVFERDPGALNHSRWLTTANRILRFYVSQANSFTSLILIAEFIMKVYAPMWFRIKCNSSVVNGAKHLHEAIQKTRHIPSEIQEIVLPIIQRNGYFSQSEDILLAMVNDENMIVRELGLRRVLRSRKLCEGSLTKINSDADIYYEMIDWQNVAVTPPPLLHDFTNDEIDKAIVEGNPLLLGSKLLNIPCHTQAVERMIILVTVASGKVCGQTSRDGYIGAALQSRK